jgi:hypothetical protein
MFVYLKGFRALYPSKSIPFTNRKGTEEWPLVQHIEYNLIGCFRKEYKKTNKQKNISIKCVFWA